MSTPTTSRCTRCGGTGYRCFREGAAARARACECQTPCPLCGGTGFRERLDAQGYQYVGACRCRGLHRRIERFNGTHLPAKFFDRSLFNYEPASEVQATAQAAVYQFIRAYEPGCQGFVLMGPVGTGKTHLLCATLAHLTLEMGQPCRFVDFFQLLSSIREGYSQNRSSSDLLGPLENVPVLAVDELGKGRNTEWELSVLDEIISKRYNQQKTTLFTTNYTDDPETTLTLGVGEPKVSPMRGPRQSRFERRVLRETLEERLGPRIYSRLREMCSFVLVTGPDRRQRVEARPASTQPEEQPQNQR